MFIAHLPAGYLLTTTLQRKFRRSDFMHMGLLASVLPDFDLLYFYLIDNNQTAHHHFAFHLPLFWLVVCIVSVAIAWRYSSLKFPLILFFANIFLHMILDSYAAPIYWLYPFSDKPIELIHVPAHYDFWVWNFILHWSFLAELCLVGIAFCRWRKNSTITNSLSKAKA